MSVESGLVSTEWLAGHLDDPSVKILEATLHMFDTGRDGRAEYAESHIPGARYFDIDENSDEISDYPHMLPPPEVFASIARALSLSNADTIIVYDRSDIRSAARVWWMFRVFGHDRVAILDGGFDKWTREGRPVTDTVPPVVHGHFLAGFHRNRIASLSETQTASQNGGATIVDARGPGRFSGAETEPRPNLRAGHIPGSVNVYYKRLYADDGTLLAPDDLRAQFAASGVPLDAPVITSCGSGITACILAHALEQLGNTAVRVYDGSWVEWGSRDDTEVDTGE